ncbi:MAG: SDR family oxidoreductase [Candidatus Lokiarchaeota archaeon]|nr:SDR family oxidoreductase [Candidatus Lokiarchaeota archaeon]
MNVPFRIDLKDKTVVVTGGGGELCGYFSKALAKCNAKVAILDLRKEAAESLAREISKEDGIAIGIEANVLELESLRKAEMIIKREFGSCNILINGAGGNHPKGTTSNEFLTLEDLDNEKEGIITFFDLDQKGIEYVFDLNFIGTLLPTQVFSKHMINQKGSSIINISSMNAFTPLTKIPAYSGAKAAVSNFTKWLAVHFSKVNIRVNAIAPGFFLTEQNRSLLTKPDGSFTERAERIKNLTPIGRFGNPEELIGTLLWLIDEKASGFVNGVIIPVDGGFSAYSGV